MIDLRVLMPGIAVAVWNVYDTRRVAGELRRAGIRVRTIWENPEWPNLTVVVPRGQVEQTKAELAKRGW